MCKNCKKISDKEYRNRTKNCTKKKEYMKKYNKKYREENTEYYKEYKRNNKEIAKKQKKEYRIKNRATLNSQEAKRRFAKHKATPEWSELAMINILFEKAKWLESLTGLKYHIDHIIPLKSNNVCGLHVWQNLQILDATLNLQKSNKIGDLE